MSEKKHHQFDQLFDELLNVVIEERFTVDTFGPKPMYRRKQQAIHSSFDEAVNLLDQSDSKYRKKIIQLSPLRKRSFSERLNDSGDDGGITFDELSQIIAIMIEKGTL